MAALPSATTTNCHHQQQQRQPATATDNNGNCHQRQWPSATTVDGNPATTITDGAPPKQWQLCDKPELHCGPLNCWVAGGKLIKNRPSILLKPSTLRRLGTKVQGGILTAGFPWLEPSAVLVSPCCLLQAFPQQQWQSAATTNNTGNLPPTTMAIRHH